jgi:sensor histidine kinase regulating citrate/malate metabolism
MKEEKEKELKELICLAIESLGVAVTIIDTKGTLLYYNKHAAKILDRKPEYIGKDVYSHHMKATSSEKLESMIQAFQKGRTEPFHYEARPYGKTILVALSPILENDKFIGCAQSVQLKEDIESKYEMRSPR